ncbi:MAG TPA: hypothetical protein VEP89_12860 [Draconibacterium sp.]|nr:hypothetical protein [Draconibacterium sp.]
MQVDNQTVSDIELFSRNKGVNSLYNYYNRTITNGGSEKLYNFLRNPVSDYQFLQERKNEIQFFYTNEIRLELTKRTIDFIEHYRKIGRFPLRANWIDAITDGVQNKIVEDGNYYIIREGIFHLLNLLLHLKRFLDGLKDFEVPKSLQNKLAHCHNFLEQKSLALKLEQLPGDSYKLKWIVLGKLDTLFRLKMKSELQEVMNTIYMIDVWQTLAGLLKDKRFSMADYQCGEKPVFEVEECFHPFLDEPVKNSFNFINESNLCFLTGPNMSGKSTFLKTLGLIIYVSHLGFPVPAKRVKTSIYKGLFTTINLSDNLNLGFSHFYTEVKRVKDMALELKSQQSIFVIFDELFKGTNVKDAYDSTLMVVKALSKIKGSTFFISSHILEVAEDISGTENIDFRCFESALVNDKAVYDFKLKEGVSKERVGFQIVKREMIEDILEEIICNQQK